CAPGRARLLAPALGALLREAGHAHPVLWARGGLCLLRRRARRAPLRPDEGRHHPRRPAERRPAGRERGILAFCRALGLSAPGLSPLSGPDEGQGRAPHPLPERELRLRPRVRGRRRSGRPTGALARAGEPESPPDHEGGAPRALPSRRATPPPPPGRAALPLARPPASSRTRPA